MEAGDLRKLQLDLNFGEVDQDNAGLQFKVTVHIGQEKADEVLNGIKEKYGVEANMKPVILFDADTEEHAEELVNLANPATFLAKAGCPEEAQGEIIGKVEAIAQPSVKRQGKTIIGTRLEEIVPAGMVADMIGPVQELLSESQSIKFEINSMVNVADALENDKNFELEFFTGANIHLEINFHKHLIAKGLQAVAGVLQKSEMVEPFLPLLEVGSELLEHLKIKFDFKSINDIPEALQTLLRKNLPDFLKLKKLLLKPFRDDQAKTIALAAEPLTAVTGPIKIVQGVEGVAVVEVEAFAPAAFSSFMGLMKMTEEDVDAYYQANDDDYY